MRRMRKPIVITAVVAAVLASAGIAFAYWTRNGSGTGSAATGSNAGIVVNQTSSITGLAPGGLPQVLSGNFDNPNSSSVFVTAVTATVTGTDTAGCGPSDYLIAGVAPVAAQIPPGSGVGSWTGLTIQFNNKLTTNQDACKGAVVSIAYTSN